VAPEGSDEAASAVADAVATVALAKEESWNYALPEMEQPVTTVTLGSVSTDMDDEARSYEPLRFLAEKSKGRDITPMRPDQRARAGIGWVPQERNIFRSLTVEENMTAVAQPGPWTVARVYEMFPRLKERRNNFGNQLSGGEQQMLAIGRALTLNPKVLLLDEPTEGLAPIIVEELLKAIGSITRAGGTCSIIVEQNAQKILGLADRVVILERGAIVHDAASAALKADPAVLERYLGVAGKS